MEVPDLTFTLSQQADSLGGHLIIHASGGKYEYTNVNVNHTITTWSNQIDIYFTGTSCEGGDCYNHSYDRWHEASTNIHFNTVQDGIYKLTIRMNHKTYTGTVEIKSDKYKVNIDPTKKLPIKFYQGKNEINRIPLYALYGCVSDFGSKPISSYFDTLADLGVVPQSFLTGSYGNFYPIRQGNYIQPNLAELLLLCFTITATSIRSIR